MLGKTNRGGLLKVAIEENREYRELIEKSEIENAYHNENKKKFSQTINTLVIREQLAQDLRYNGNSLVCQHILKDIYDLLDNLNEYSKDYIVKS